MITINYAEVMLLSAVCFAWGYVVCYVKFSYAIDRLMEKLDK